MIILNIFSLIRARIINSTNLFPHTKAHKILMLNYEEGITW